MKSIITSIIVVLSLIFTNNLPAQNNKITIAEIQVKGVCGMCKERIENAAYIKGVKKVDWDKETKILAVTFRNDKISELEIHQSISKAGHATNKVEADSKAYNSLPGCCAYDDGVKTH